jgi:hypothetical protein
MDHDVYDVGRGRPDVSPRISSRQQLQESHRALDFCWEIRVERHTSCQQSRLISRMNDKAETKHLVCAVSSRSINTTESAHRLLYTIAS